MTTLVVQTARVSFRGSDRIDITRKSAGPDGIAFAPTWEILRAVQAARKSGDAQAYDRAWDTYVLRYTAEMRVSFGMVPGSDAYETMALSDAAEVDAALRRGVRPAPGSWSALLERESATLVCYCPTPNRCHRRLLAEILKKLGARYLGEVR